MILLKYLEMYVIQYNQADVICCHFDLVIQILK